EQPVGEVEEAPVVRSAAWHSHRMVRAMVAGRVQYVVEEPALEVDVGMIQQSRDSGVHVVEDDDLLTSADHEHHQSPGPYRQEDVDGIEVRRPQHLEPVQAVMDGVYPPQERDLVCRAVVPVLEEIDEQRRQEQLDQDGGIRRPDVRHPEVVMVVGGPREQAEHEEYLKGVDRRCEQEIDDVRTGGVADVAPTSGERDPEL